MRYGVFCVWNSHGKYCDTFISLNLLNRLMTCAVEYQIVKLIMWKGWGVDYSANFDIIDVDTITYNNGSDRGGHEETLIISHWHVPIDQMCHYIRK